MTVAVAGATTTHTHDFTTIVRMRGSKVRKQCACKRIGPWTRDSIAAPTIKGNVMAHPDYTKMTVPELREEARQAGLHGYSKATKADLIAMLVTQD